MPAQGCWILGGNNMNIHFSEHSCYAELQNWSSSMVIFIRHDKLLFNTYIEKCWEIRPESLFQWSRLNLHTWRHLSGKITVLPSAWIPLMELYFRYTKHAELHTSISAWVSVPSDIFSNISSSMYSLCTPAEPANPQINACTTTLRGRLSYFISFSAHCVSTVPWLEAVVAWSVVSAVQQ